MIKHRLYYAIHSIADQFKSFKSNGISFSVAIRIQSYLLHRHQQFDSYALTYISTSLIQFFLVFIFRHSFMNTRVDIQIKQNWFARFADANPNLYLQIREIYPGKFLHMIVLVTFHSFPVSFLFKTHVTLTQFLLQTLISGMYRNHGYVFSETVQWCGDDRYGMSEIEEFPLCQLDANQMQTITESSLANILLPHDFFFFFNLLPPSHPHSCAGILSIFIGRIVFYY